MLRRFPMFVICCLLASCATPESLLAAKPDDSINTTAKAEDVRDCLIMGKPSFEVQATQAGYTVMYALRGLGSVAPRWMVAITKTPTGSHVEAHWRGTDPSLYDRDVKPCLDKLPRA